MVNTMLNSIDQKRILEEAKIRYPWFLWSVSGSGQDLICQDRLGLFKTSHGWSVECSDIVACCASNIKNHRRRRPWG